MSIDSDIGEVVAIMRRLDQRGRWKVLGFAEDVEKRHIEVVQLARQMVNRKAPAPVLTLVASMQASTP